MRKYHLNSLTKVPANAQDPLIQKLEGTTAWIQMLLNIQRTSLFKEIFGPGAITDPGGNGGGGGGVGGGFG